MVLASLSSRRDLIRQRLRYALAIGGVGFCTFAIAQKFTEQPKALLIALVTGVVIGSRFRPRHSRYIRRRDRRKAIAEFERGGERYNPKRHEIDHVVPYSRGGGNNADNLSVIPRERNRAKAGKSPWWDVLG